ncbi:MAG TPA: A24 family peptidase [Spirillospora sp.]
MLTAAGLVVGLPAASLAAPFGGDVTLRDRAAVGIVTAAVYGVLGWRIGPEPVLAALCYLAAVGVLLGFVDLRTRRLPDRFTLPSYGIAATLLAAAVPFTVDGPRRFLGALIGMVLLYVLYYVQALVPSGVGMGDVKLAGVLGLCLGWFGMDAWLAGLLASSLLGGVAGLGVLIVRRTRKGEFAYGPYMLAGALIGVLAFPSG